MVWLSLIDVNGLSAADADHLAALDVEDDDDLSTMISGWMKPRFDEHDAHNRAEIRAILETG